MSKSRRGRPRDGLPSNPRYHNNRNHSNHRGFTRSNNPIHGRDNRENSTVNKPEGIYLNHSILTALSHLVGKSVQVVFRNNSIYEGIFCTISPKADIVLKCVHLVDNKQINGVNSFTTSPIPTKDNVREEMVIDFQNIVRLRGKIDKITKGGKLDGFAVDSELSKRKYQNKGERRELQKWSDSTITTAFDDMTLESDNNNNGWAYEDMIRTNEEKFNVSSVYDENMSEYTVPVPECDEETKRKAARLAEDIENKATTNIHIAEERGQIIPLEIGEEDRFSAVVRPGTFIKVGDHHHKDYAADIPAPLSQIDEPSEDVFKEEKEAAIAQVAALKSPATDDNKINTLIKDSNKIEEQQREVKKCVVETQTDVYNSPHNKTVKSVSLSDKDSVLERNPTKQLQKDKSLEDVPSPPGHLPPQGVQQPQPPVQQPHQKQIMKPGRRADDKKDIVMGMKPSYEDPTHRGMSAHHGAGPTMAMMSKPRNDSMSSESSLPLSQGSYQHRHSVGHMQNIPYAAIQHQHQQQIIQQMQMQQLAAVQHAAAAHHASVATPHVLQPSHYHGTPNMGMYQQSTPLPHIAMPPHQRHTPHPPPEPAKTTSSLNPDAMEFKPGSAASSPAPKPMVMSTSGGGGAAQQTGHVGGQSQQQQPGGGGSGAAGGGGAHGGGVPQFQPPQIHVDKNSNMVMLPAVIPTQVRQNELMLQQGGIQGGNNAINIVPQYAPHLLLYSASHPIPSRYIGPSVSMATAMAQQHMSHDQNTSGNSIMSSSSSVPTPQVMYPHQQQVVVSQGQYINPAVMAQIHHNPAAGVAVSQIPHPSALNNGQPGSSGPFANPLQPPLYPYHTAG